MRTKPPKSRKKIKLLVEESVLEQIMKKATEFQNRSRDGPEPRKAAWSLQMKQRHAAGAAENLTGDPAAILEAVEELLKKRKK